MEGLYQKFARMFTGDGAHNLGDGGMWTMVGLCLVLLAVIGGLWWLKPGENAEDEHEE